MPSTSSFSCTKHKQQSVSSQISTSTTTHTIYTMSLSTSSRRYHQAQKPTITYSREPSTDSRSSESSSTTYHSSGRSSTSNTYHSSSQSREYHEPGRVYTFRAPDAGLSPLTSTTRRRQLTNLSLAENYQGTYQYSNSNKIKVIHHRTPLEEDPRLRSSEATHEDYKRTQQRVERHRSDRR